MSLCAIFCMNFALYFEFFENLTVSPVIDMCFVTFMYA